MKKFTHFSLVLMICATTWVTGCSKDANPTGSQGPDPSQPGQNTFQPLPAELLGIWVYTAAESNSSGIALSEALDWEDASAYAAFEITADSLDNFLYYEMDGDLNLTSYNAGHMSVTGSSFTVSNGQDGYSGTWLLHSTTLEMTVSAGNRSITLFAVKGS